MQADLRIFNSNESLSRHAAELFIERTEKSITERGRFLLALNGGSTPEPLFKLLGTDYKDQPDWKHIHVFWGDERCVPMDDPGSNFRQADTHFLSRVSIPRENIHRVKGELEPAQAAMDYSLTLKKFASPPDDIPRFDLVFLGMGEDGHTASLFPGSPVDVTGTVLPVTAHYQDRPADRVTMTQNVFNRAQMVVFVVTGANKAETLAKVLSGPYQPETYPAQRVDPQDGQLIWLLDQEAASRLPRELTKKYCEG